MSTDAIDRINAALEGRYRVEREVGQGGMATVYLADDLRHERKVALKVLKPELAAVVGADRFLTEIKTTAGLQHPHILPLHDSGEADGLLFFVMPYIEGETLGDRIDRDRQLPVDEALGIATAVANALQAAHDKGVVHRDIKPGNILLSNGEPLVADFGIALAVGSAGGSRLTETGLSVGTPYYMSPEQATGDQAIGAASDTYSLACVLYEMLVGEPPYPGNTAQAVLGKIIQGIPVSATAVRKTIPYNIDAAIRKALERLPADRFRTAHDFAKALADPAFRHGESLDGVAAGAGSVWNPVSKGLAATVVLLLGALGWSLTRAPAPAMTTRQVIADMWNGQERAIGAMTALAPDGSGMVFARGGATLDQWQLWFKSPGATEPVALGGTENGQNVVYSPDGTHIAFAVGTDIKTRPIGDGATVTIAEDASSIQIGIAWMDDGTILYEGPGPSVRRVPEGGGAAESLAEWPEMQQLSYIGPLPGSRGSLVNVCPGACQSGSLLYVLDLATNDTRQLLDDVIRAWYLPTGHLMYVRGDGAVFAAPFDPDALELTGTGVPLFDGVRIEISTPELQVANDGTMLLRTGAVTTPGRRVVWIDRAGNVTPVDTVNLPTDQYWDVSLSPNDDRLALSIVVDGLTRVWAKELPSGPRVRLTTGERFGLRPDWSADGRNIAYATQSDTAWSIRADGSGPPQPLFVYPRPNYEVHLLPDGRVLARFDTNGSDDIAVYDPASDSMSMLIASDFAEWVPQVSPDGRFIAYVSEQSGTRQVYVRPFPSLDGQTQVSTTLGESPVWAHNGREILYLDGDFDLIAAEYVTEPDFRVTRRTALFNAAELDLYRPNNEWKIGDVTQDDQRFVALQQASVGLMEEQRIVLVQNYFTELKERLGR